MMFFFCRDAGKEFPPETALAYLVDGHKEGCGAMSARAETFLLVAPKLFKKSRGGREVENAEKVSLWRTATFVFNHAMLADIETAGSLPEMKVTNVVGIPPMSTDGTIMAVGDTITKIKGGSSEMMLTPGVLEVTFKRLDVQGSA